MDPLHRNPLPSLARDFFYLCRLLLPALMMLVLLNTNTPAQQSLAQSELNAAGVTQPTGKDGFALPLVRTDSPRQTLATLLRLREALEATLLAYEQNRSLKNAAAVSIIGENLRSLIDLSEVPLGSRKQIGTETIGFLLDIIGRIDTIKIEDVPDVDAYKDTGPANYRIAKTPLQISRVEQGSQWGEFLFNRQTVEVAPRFDRGIEDLPLRTSLPIKSWADLQPQLTGPLFPAVRLSALPNILKKSILNTPIWKIISVVVISIVAALLLRFWYRAGALFNPKKRITQTLFRILNLVVIIVVITTLNSYFHAQVVVTGDFSRIIDFVYSLIFYAIAAWIFWLGVLTFFELAVVDTSFPDNSLDADMMRLIARIIGAVGGIFIIAYGAQEMGVPVLSMLTGLGIGGIAIALAIRPTLENLIGGFILYIDRPVKVGDFCNFGDMSGTVETIGIRSTQIRSLERTLISIPNSQFADMQLVNWARCDHMLITHTIGLRYETERDQLRYVLAKIREMFHSHPRIDQETIRVRFSGYGASSLDILIRVYAKTREWNDFYAIKEDVLLRIGDIVKQSGTGFAFPSQTLYMGKDDGLDVKLGEKAKEEVAAWRRSRQLPFPKFAASKLENLTGKLDYPPRGSPDFNATEEELAEGAEPLSAEPLQEQGDEPVEERKTSASTEPK